MPRGGELKSTSLCFQTVGGKSSYKSMDFTKIHCTFAANLSAIPPKTIQKYSVLLVYSLGSCQLPALALVTNQVKKRRKRKAVPTILVAADKKRLF